MLQNLNQRICFSVFFYGRKGPAEEEPWLYEPGRVGDFELFAFDRASVAFTRSAPAFLECQSSLSCPEDSDSPHRVQLVCFDSAAKANH